MSIYDLDYNQKAAELLPPDKRQSAFLAWVKSLFTPLIYNRGRMFVDYKQGIPAVFSAGDTYNKGEKAGFIRDGNGYISLVDGNNSYPYDADKWQFYQADFIGVDERLTYNSSKIVLENALNRRFDTTFRQPPSVSDIYIETNVIPIFPFIVGGVEGISSSVYFDHSDEYIIDDYSFGTFDNFTIYVPYATWVSLSNDVSARDKVIRNFVDKYNIVGTFYNIVTY